MSKAPESSVTVWRVKLVAVLVIAMVAPGIPASLWSRTLPTTEPYSTCADALCVAVNMNNAIGNSSILAICGTPIAGIVMRLTGSYRPPLWESRVQRKNNYAAATVAHALLRAG